MIDYTEDHRRKELALKIDEQFIRNYESRNEWRTFIVSAHELELHFYERACPLCNPGCLDSRPESEREGIRVQGWSILRRLKQILPALLI